MIFADKKNETQLMALIPSIKRYMNEWHIVNVNLLKDSPLSQQEIIDRLLSNYARYDGLIYPVTPKKVVMLARLGIIQSYGNMKADIESAIPAYCCRVLLKKMSEVGMKQIQIDLVERDETVKLVDNLYYQRERRKENVIILADDDKFIRASMSKMLSSCGTLIEVETGSAVISRYLKYNPDIIFLDIHMPGINGLDLIRDIIELDQDAFIIILSGDSMKENVIRALEEGATGFLSKPPSKKKVQEYIGQCITIR